MPASTRELRLLLYWWGCLFDNAHCISSSDASAPGARRFVLLCPDSSSSCLLSCSLERSKPDTLVLPGDWALHLQHIGVSFHLQLLSAIRVDENESLQAPVPGLRG